MSLDPNIDFTDTEDVENPEFQENQPQQPGGALRHVREALERTTQAKSEAEARAVEAERQLAAAQREIALNKVSLPDFPGKGYFLSTYAGEATQEAVEAAARDAGFQVEGSAATAPAAPETPVVPAAELDAHRAVSAAAAGSVTSNDIPLDQAILDAKSPEEVLAILQKAPADSGVRVLPNVVASDAGTYFNR